MSTINLSNEENEAGTAAARRWVSSDKSSLPRLAFLRSALVVAFTTAVGVAHATDYSNFDCTSPSSLRDISANIDAMPAVKNHELQTLDLLNPQTISATHDQVICKFIIAWSDGEHEPAQFRYYDNSFGERLFGLRLWIHHW
jgi:hypothetical protein